MEELDYHERLKKLNAYSLERGTRYVMDGSSWKKSENN